MADFKEDMHHVYIRACEDPEQTWTTLPFIAINDAILVVLDTWPPEWHRPDVIWRDENAIQKQKAEAKLLAQQKRNE